MDAKQFLAEFGHLANAPGGVGRLRELVLHLAVAGDLTSSEAPVDAKPLLEIIEKQKKEHPDRKKVVPKQAPVSRQAIKVPPHWAICRLGDLTLTVTGGGTPSKNNPAYWGGTIPWASVKDMRERKFLDDTEDYITEEGLRNSSSNLIPPGRVIVCTRMGLGKVAINSVALAINQDLKALELPAEVNSDFFQILYKTREVKGTGMTVSGIKQKQLLALIAALPPIEEQVSIVAKVDELMALCDRLEEQQKIRSKLQTNLRQSTLQTVATATSPNELKTAWTRLAENFGELFNASKDVDDLRRAILDLSVSGYLSAQGELDEPAEYLKAKILAAKEKGIADGSVSRKKHVKPEELKETILPSHWESITLDEAISKIDAGWSPACLPRARGDERKWGVLKTTAVQVLRFFPDEHKELPASLDPRPQYQIKVGDILITRAGPRNRVGICCVVGFAPPRLMISDKLIRFHIVDDLINPHFVSLCLSAGEPGRIVERLKSGMADSQMNISQDKLRSITIPLPPIEEQQRILTKIDGLMDILEAYSERLGNSERLAEQVSAAAVSALTGIAIEQEEEPMKAPKTELIAPLRLGSAPGIKAQAPLATILARNNGELAAKDLWQRFGGEIDDFYAQLKTEVAHGWVLEPAPGEMREKQNDTVSV